MSVSRLAALPDHSLYKLSKLIKNNGFTARREDDFDEYSVVAQAEECLKVEILDIYDLFQLSFGIMD